MDLHGEGQLADGLERFTQNLLQTTWRSWYRWVAYPQSLDYRDKERDEGHPAIITQLVDVGLEMDPAHPILISVYHMLCYHGDLERVKKLTDLGMSVHAIKGVC